MKLIEAARTPATAAAFAVALLYGGAASAGGSHTVVIDNDAFNPKTVTIAAGQVVTFTNKEGEEHTVTADDNSFDSKPMTGTFQHRFTRPGRYPYHCTIHPFMHGVVIVK